MGMASRWTDFRAGIGGGGRVQDRGYTMTNNTDEGRLGRGCRIEGVN